MDSKYVKLFLSRLQAEKNCELFVSLKLEAEENFLLAGVYNDKAEKFGAVADAYKECFEVLGLAEGYEAFLQEVGL